MSETALRQMNPLQLAYIGDAVYTLHVRLHQMKRGGKLKDVHKASALSVCAHAQSRALELLLDSLTEQEKDIIRRGRNARAKHSAPKSASAAEYAGSTAFEALVGYLYLSGQHERMHQLLQEALLFNEEEPYAGGTA